MRTIQHKISNKHKFAPVCRIHVSFGRNQQPAGFNMTINGSEMQSGALETRTENQKPDSKTQHNTKSVTIFITINAHQFVAFTSALEEISNRQASTWP
jgi:hypothetical protein